MAIDDFADLMNATVTVEPFSSRGDYGDPTYGTAVSYSARVSYRQVRVRSRDGTESVARGAVWLRSSVAVDERDRLTLPDGSAPPILAVDRPGDADGSPHHTKVFFG